MGRIPLILCLLLLGCDGVNQENGRQYWLFVLDHERRHCYEGDFHPDSLQDNPRHYSYSPGEVEITIIENDERVAALTKRRQDAGDKFDHGGYSSGPQRIGSKVFCTIWMPVYR